MNTPSEIFIVRHAEKPGECHTDGPNDGPNLSIRGHQRAACLALLKPFPDNTHHVIATKKTKGSVRPIETITPYANTIKIDINTKWADDDYQKLADRLLTKKKYKGKIIVIAWHHGKIPFLIKALGGDVTVAPIIKGKWDEKVFDRIIHLEYLDDGSVTTESKPQQLLYGDSAK